jgi:uncharacterized RDD family membrane protein YckC
MRERKDISKTAVIYGVLILFLVWSGVLFFLGANFHVGSSYPFWDLSVISNGKVAYVYYTHSDETADQHGSTLYASRKPWAQYYLNKEWRSLPAPPAMGDLLLSRNSLKVIAADEEFSLDITKNHGKNARWSRPKAAEPANAECRKEFVFQGNEYVSYVILDKEYSFINNSSNLRLFNQTASKNIQLQGIKQFEIVHCQDFHFIPFDNKLYFFHYERDFGDEVHYSIFDGRRWGKDRLFGKEIKEFFAAADSRYIYLFFRPGYPGDEDGLTVTSDIAIRAKRFNGKTWESLKEVIPGSEVYLYSGFHAVPVNDEIKVFTLDSTNEEAPVNVWELRGTRWVHEDAPWFLPWVYSHEIAWFYLWFSIAASVFCAVRLSLLISRFKESKFEAFGETHEAPSLLRRGVALLIDWIVIIGIQAYVLEILDRIVYNNGNEQILILLVFIPISYYTTTEAAFNCTIGKFIMRMRIVSGRRGRIGLKKAFVRNIFRLMEGPLCYVPAMMCLADSREYQRAGDSAAKTVVVMAKRRKAPQRSAEQIYE